MKINGNGFPDNDDCSGFYRSTAKQLFVIYNVHAINKLLKAVVKSAGALNLRLSTFICGLIFAEAPDINHIKFIKTDFRTLP